MLLPIPALKAAGVETGRKLPDFLEKANTNEIGPVGQALYSAMYELFALLRLVESFLTGDDHGQEDVREWLESLRVGLMELDKDIKGGYLVGYTNISDLGVLDDCLDAMPELDVDPDNDLHVLAGNMLDFWLSEVKRRGYEIVHIALVAVDVLEANRIFKTVRELRYPIA